MKKEENELIFNHIKSIKSFDGYRNDKANFIHNLPKHGIDLLSIQSELDDLIIHGENYSSLTPKYKFSAKARKMREYNTFEEYNQSIDNKYNTEENIHKILTALNTYSSSWVSWDRALFATLDIDFELSETLFERITFKQYIEYMDPIGNDTKQYSVMISETGKNYLYEYDNLPESKAKNITNITGNYNQVTQGSSHTENLLSASIPEGNPTKINIFCWIWNVISENRLLATIVGGIIAGLVLEIIIKYFKK
jgi:hypothetical protein